MFRRFWQSMMIGLARSARITRFMQTNRTTSVLADRYTGGDDAHSGVSRAGALWQESHMRSSLFYLGEYIENPDLVTLNTVQKIEVAGKLAAAGLDVHISFDPTQLGFGLAPEIARENALRIATEVKHRIGQTTSPEHLHCLMFDMEDASVIDATIAMHDEFAELDYPVALTLQAYLHRTKQDLERQIRRGHRVRLVKGAFVAGSDISHTVRVDIKQNMRDLICLMFSKTAKESGFYPIVATHDAAIQDFALAQAQKNGWEQGRYEFEMLLGVRENLAQDLAKNGERIRLYVPFGKDWWPYGVRRIGENPGNGLLLARSLFS